MLYSHHLISSSRKGYREWLPLRCDKKDGGLETRQVHENID